LPSHHSAPSVLPTAAGTVPSYVPASSETAPIVVAATPTLAPCLLLASVPLVPHVLMPFLSSYPHGHAHAHHSTTTAMSSNPALPTLAHSVMLMRSDDGDRMARTARNTRRGIGRRSATRLKARGMSPKEHHPRSRPGVVARAGDFGETGTITATSAVGGACGWAAVSPSPHSQSGSGADSCIQLSQPNPPR
jgi:hypothetical protein